jgi:hypothetical protein
LAVAVAAHERVPELLDLRAHVGDRLGSIGCRIIVCIGGIVIERGSVNRIEREQSRVHGLPKITHGPVPFLPAILMCPFQKRGSALRNRQPGQTLPPS